MKLVAGSDTDNYIFVLSACPDSFGRKAHSEPKQVLPLMQSVNMAELLRQSTFIAQVALISQINLAASVPDALKLLCACLNLPLNMQLLMKRGNNQRCCYLSLHHKSPPISKHTTSIPP